MPSAPAALAGVHAPELIKGIAGIAGRGTTLAVGSSSSSDSRVTYATIQEMLKWPDEDAWIELTLQTLEPDDGGSTYLNIMFAEEADNVHKDPTLEAVAVFPRIIGRGEEKEEEVPKSINVGLGVVQRVGVGGASMMDARLAFEALVVTDAGYTVTDAHCEDAPRPPPCTREIEDLTHKYTYKYTYKRHTAADFKEAAPCPPPAPQEEAPLEREFRGWMEARFLRVDARTQRETTRVHTV
jgi:hypothetical protein